MDQGLGWVVRLGLSGTICKYNMYGYFRLFVQICSFTSQLSFTHFLLAVGGGSGLAEARDTGEDLFTVGPDLFH